MSRTAMSPSRAHRLANRLRFVALVVFAIGSVALIAHPIGRTVAWPLYLLPATALLVGSQWLYPTSSGNMVTFVVFIGSLGLNAIVWTSQPETNPFTLPLLMAACSVALFCSWGNPSLPVPADS